MSDKPRISFSGTALREHFEGNTEMEALLGDLTDAELEAVAHNFLWQTTEVWERFGSWAAQIVREADAEKKRGPLDNGTTTDDLS